MIAFFYGTSAELIKLAPVMRRLQAREIRFEQWVTAQHVSQLETLCEELGLPQIDFWASRGAPGGRDLVRKIDVPLWLLRTCASFARSYRSLRRRLSADGRARVVVVHGDTMTTPLGALFGRLLTAQVAHVEAGLRSDDIWNPFPEELDRRITSRLAHVHYAPGDGPSSNVANHGDVVNTQHNTLRDSVEMAHEVATDVAFEGVFGVVSLHRQELISNRDLFTRTIEHLAAAASKHRLVFIEHNVTMNAMRRFGLEARYRTSGLIGRPRMSYFDFTALLSSSSFLITDSGGGQEEAFFLDLPCLIHRLRTERSDGLGENAVLSRFDLSVVDRFLGDPTAYRRKADLPAHGPSDIIVSDMLARQWA